jgi:hypothetical protein
MIAREVPALDNILTCTPSFTDMDGFKLLETIGLELDLPVISECAAQVGICKKREPQLSSLVADLAMG